MAGSRFKATWNKSYLDSQKQVRHGGWWGMPVIPATQEAMVEELQSKVCPRLSAKPYLKDKLKLKGLGE
jgi:hypothetical protein